jgi:hypothetical protein
LAEHTISEFQRSLLLAENTAASITDARDPSFERRRIYPSYGGDSAARAAGARMQHLHRAFGVWRSRRIQPVRQGVTQANTNLVRLGSVPKHINDCSENTRTLALCEYDVSRQGLTVLGSNVFAQLKAPHHTTGPTLLP